MTFAPRPTVDTRDPRPVALTFVNSHLAAFDEMYEKRNADFHDLSRRLQFDSGISAAGIALPTVPLNVYQSDALFWMGGWSSSNAH
jgi:inositol polyphosphate 5-phosphatase INPP5B/F